MTPRQPRTLKEKYTAPTPVKWRKIGDAILLGSTGLSALMMGAPIPDKVQVWIVFGLNVLGLIGKIITNFFTEEDVQKP
jgi:hypothetical protein